MNNLTKIKSFSILEAFIPLLFYVGADVFYAAALIPLMGGLTLVVLELVRRLPERLLSGLYFMWIAVIGLIFWYSLAISPYWIWGVHILISESARGPSEHQRKKPFLFGFKKYTKKRTIEFSGALAGIMISATLIYFLRPAIPGVSFWMVIILLFAMMQMIINFTRRKAV